MVAIFAPGVRSNIAVDAADVCREAGNWSQAATHYRRALRIRPDRRPIWVQLGHVLKEDERLEESLGAYREASALPGTDGDAPLHHGVLAKQLGEFAEAKAALRQACRETPGNVSARAELLEILHDRRAIGDRAKELAILSAEAEAARLVDVIGLEQPAVVFDTSDLISYFRHSRLPTGIQRVQMEVIRNALGTDPATQIACFSDDNGSWTRLPASLFEKICELSIKSADVIEEEWVDLIEIITATLCNNNIVNLPKGSFIVNLGTSWWLRNYFLHVRHYQREQGIYYIPFIHDFIPIMMPEHCVQQLTQDFLSWTHGVFDHADFYLVNSRSTAADLHRVAGVLGHEIVESHVAVVPLDADFRRSGVDAAPVRHLAEWKIAQNRFALFVSTIESRKNHLMVFHAWRELINRHGLERVPELVCVGNRGWLNDQVYAMLANDSILASKIRMLSHLSDEHLALLYQTCLFTVYTSLYEGWGLPVTESLCYGKIPLLSKSSSLPEAGGSFARYVDAEDLGAMVAELESLCFDSTGRQTQEARIEAEFRPRQWSDVALQVRDELRRFTDLARRLPRKAAMPRITFDKLYRIKRNRQTRLAPHSDEGEVLRYGVGWLQLEDWGCSTRPEGGELGFAVSAGLKEVRCFLRLRGPQGTGSAATVTSGDRAFRAELLEGQWRWVSVVAQVDGGEVRLAIRGHDTVDVSIERFGHDRRRIGPGLSSVIVVEDPEIRTFGQLAHRLAGKHSGAYGFLRDVYPILLNRDLDDFGLQDYLLAIETGGMTMEQVVDTMMRSPEAAANARTAAIFD